MKTKLSLFTLLLLGAIISAGIQPCAATTKEFYYDSGNLFDTSPTQPLADLSRAFKHQKQFRFMRISWDGSSSSSRNYSVILYDRQRHTLRYYYQADSLITEDIPIIREQSSETILYSGVKDVMIDRLLAKYLLAGMGADEIFPKLVDYGCKKRVLKKKSHRYTVKQLGDR